MLFKVEVELKPLFASSRLYRAHLAEEGLGGKHEIHVRPEIEIGGNCCDELGR